MEATPESRGYGCSALWLGLSRAALHLLALLYDLKVPRWDFQTGRQLRTSPLYDRLDAQGARWMEKHGFERPKYFIPPDKGKKARSHICSFCPQNNKSWFGLVLNHGFLAVSGLCCRAGALSAAPVGAALRLWCTGLVAEHRL